MARLSLASFKISSGIWLATLGLLGPFELLDPIDTIEQEE